MKQTKNQQLQNLCTQMGRYVIIIPFILSQLIFLACWYISGLGRTPDMAWAYLGLSVLGSAGTLLFYLSNDGTTK